MSIWNTFGRIKDEVAWKAGKAIDKVVDTKDDISSFASKTADKISYKKDKLLEEAKWTAREAKWKVEDVSRSVKDTVSDKVFDARSQHDNFMKKLHSRGTAITSEKVMNALMPNTAGKLSALRIRSANADLQSKINVLNDLIEHKENIEKKAQAEFANGEHIRNVIIQDLMNFSYLFQKLNHVPEIRIQKIQTVLNLKFDLMQQSTKNFSVYDNVLMKVFDDDLNVLSLLMRGSLASTLMLLREKSLTDEINKASSEVEKCIANVREYNQSVMKIQHLTYSFNKELNTVSTFLCREIFCFNALLEKVGTDVSTYNENDLIQLDNMLMMVGITVKLLNTPLYEKGATNKANTQPVKDAINESKKNLELLYGAEETTDVRRNYNR